jgi:hypothetical protein
MRHKQGLIIVGGVVLVGMLMTAMAAGVLPAPAMFQQSTVTSSCTSEPATPSSASVASVVLRTDTRCYRTTSPIIITIENHTTKTIVFRDHQSGCSVVDIALRTHDHWQQVDPCDLGVPDDTVTLGPGQRLIVTVDSPDENWEHGWLPGSYKAGLSYDSYSGAVLARATKSTTVEPAVTAESAAFTVS